MIAKKELLINSKVITKKNNKEQLQPALLDRLTDDNPKQITSKRELIMYFDDLKAAVLRDLQWLLNTTNNAGIVDYTDLDHVAGSTVNYGVNALAGKTISEISHQILIDEIKTAINNFEPRIINDSLKIIMNQSPTEIDTHNIISMTISGKLWSNPFPRDFIFATNIDLETGHVELID